MVISPMDLTVLSEQLETILQGKYCHMKIVQKVLDKKTWNSIVKFPTGTNEETAHIAICPSTKNKNQGTTDQSLKHNE